MKNSLGVSCESFLIPESITGGWQRHWVYRVKAEVVAFCALYCNLTRQGSLTFLGPALHPGHNIWGTKFLAFCSISEVEQKIFITNPFKGFCWMKSVLRCLNTWKAWDELFLFRFMPWVKSLEQFARWNSHAAFSFSGCSERFSKILG